VQGAIKFVTSHEGRLGRLFRARPSTTTTTTNTSTK
jgi:hypothetical protein